MNEALPAAITRIVPATGIIAAHPGKMVSFDMTQKGITIITRPISETVVAAVV
ncbi:hypothetical protein D3C84_1320150 [compost metagenome]